LIKNAVKNNQEFFLKNFIIVPGFKSAIHYGNVIVSLIGDLNREFVFSGDVLNTTSRIQELCNQYRQELIVSRILITQIKFPDYLDQEYLGSVQLKGKETETHLYGIFEKKVNL
jgi:adenylate cyclase